MGHNTNDCYQLKKQIEEVVASGKLAHLVKDIRRNNQKNESQGRNNVKVINMIKEGGNRKRPFEGERSGLTDELTFLATPRNQLTDEPIILEGVIEGNQKVQSSAGRFFKRNVSSSGNNRSLSNYGKGKKKQNGVNGVCDNKMSFAIQLHNRKDRNETPQNGRFYHLFYDQIPHQPRNHNNGNQQRGSMGMQTLGKGARQFLRNSFHGASTLKIYPLVRAPLVHKKVDHDTDGKDWFEGKGVPLALRKG
ncbi:hypothetical protein Tco_0630244 [Tanacetum coccineum]